MQFAVLARNVQCAMRWAPIKVQLIVLDNKPRPSP